MKKLCFILALAMLAGCDEGNKRPTTVVKCDRDYSQLAESDVIVMVNGKSLTKGDVEREIEVQAELLKIGRPNVKVSDVERMKRKSRANAEKRFVERRAMLDEAARRGLKLTAEDRREIRERFAKSVISGNKSMYGVLAAKLDEPLRKELDSGLDLDKLCQKVNSALREECRVEVTEADAKAKYKELEAYNRRAGEDEAKIWKTASNTWQRIQAGESFEKAAQRCTDADEHINADMDWGEFELEFFRDDRELCHYIAAMPVGTVTPPLTGDNGILIVKMLERIPVDFASGNLKPHYRLAKIFFELPATYPLESQEALRLEMTKLRSDTAFRKRIAELVAATKVEHPIGKVDMTSSDGRKNVGKDKSLKKNNTENKEEK